MILSKDIKGAILLIATLIISISGLIYELLEATISSYFLGDSIYHFSIVIGIFMSAMGVGAWLTRYIDSKALQSFIIVEILLSIVGGFSSIVLFFAFAVWESYSVALYLELIIIGSLIGMEIPLVMRILQENFTLKLNVSNVLSADYIGALIGSILFPLILLPYLGLLETSLLFGAMNAVVAVTLWWIFRDRLSKGYLYGALISISLIAIAWMRISIFNSYIQYRLYNDNIIFSKATPYQQITITGNRGRIKLFINGALQFDSLDEYRYHESLIHPAFASAKKHKNILIIGGGDGLALREVLKYRDIQRVDLVDIDPIMTTLFSSRDILTNLNHSSLKDRRVHIHHEDAWKFLEKSQKLYDIIIIDLPDPNNPSLGRLYSKKFYTMVVAHLSRGGVAVTQSSSPLFSRKAFWSIVHTAKSVTKFVIPYHTYIPSFGEWGFTLFSNMQIDFNFSKLPKGLRYFKASQMDIMREFPKDMDEVEADINTIFNQPLLQYYIKGWQRWYR